MQQLLMGKIFNQLVYEENLKDLYCQRPHVVIVGAGASRAVMGKSCPTMNEAIEQVGLDRILEGFMLETKSKNLEDIYSELFRRGDECKNARIAMEKNFMNIFKCAASILLDHLRPFDSFAHRKRLHCILQLG